MGCGTLHLMYYDDVLTCLLQVALDAKYFNCKVFLLLVVQWAAVAQEVECPSWNLKAPGSSWLSAEASLSKTLNP